MNSLHIVWFDPRVNNSENIHYQKDYLQGNYEYDCFTELKPTISRLDKLIENYKQVLVISCGSQGESFCKAVQGKKIEGIIIFTMNMSYHQKWIAQYKPMIIKVSTCPRQVFQSGFSSLKSLSAIKKSFSVNVLPKFSISSSFFWQKKMSNPAIQKPFNINDQPFCKDFIKYANDKVKMDLFTNDFKPLIDSTKPLYELIQSKSNFVLLTHYRQELTKFDFKKGYMILENQNQSKGIQFVIKNQKYSDVYQECVKRTMSESSLCSAQVFLKLFELCQSKQQKNILQKQIVDQCDLSTPRNILATFCLMYTGNYIYRKLNNSLANFELPFGIELMACLRNQIAALSNQEKKQVTLKSNEYPLHRGITNSTELLACKTAFWPAFTSTSLNSKTAKNFAGSQGELYEITLDSIDCHPHLKITGDSPLKSEFSNEEEILLFPNFRFRVISRAGQRVVIRQHKIYGG